MSYIRFVCNLYVLSIKQYNSFCKRETLNRHKNPVMLRGNLTIGDLSFDITSFLLIVL